MAIQQRIRLRELRQTDWRSIHSYAGLDISCRYQPWGPNSEEDTLKFVSKAIRDTKKSPRSRFAFAVIEEEKEKLIGVAELNIRDFGNKIGKSAISSTLISGAAGTPQKQVPFFFI